MARRRKKTSKNTRSKLGTGGQDKALPAIPPLEARATAYVPDHQSSPFQDAYLEAPAADVPSVSKMVSELQTEPDSRPSTSDQNASRGKHPISDACRSSANLGLTADLLTLPSSTFQNNRQSMMSQRSNLSGGGEEFLIPLAFDPTPQPVAPSPDPSHHAPQKSVEEKPGDYFTSKPTPPTSQVPPPKSNTSSPHIAYQEKGRLPSREIVEQHRRGGSLSRSGSAAASPYIPQGQPEKSEDSPRLSQIARTSEAQQSDKFKLEAAPKTKKFSPPTTGSRSEGSTPRAKSEDPVQQYAFSKTMSGQDIGSPSDRGYSTPGASNESSPAYSASNTLSKACTTTCGVIAAESTQKRRFFG